MDLEKLTKKELIALVKKFQSEPKTQNSTNKLNFEFSGLFSNIVHEAIVIMDEFKVVWVNKRTVEITGYSYEELLSANFVERIYEEDRAKVLTNHKNIFEDNNNYIPKYRFRLYDKKGNILWVENRVSPYMINGQQYSISFLLDVTEEVNAFNELSKSKLRYETVVQNSHEAILVMRDFKLIFMNRTTEIFFDEKYENLIGQDIKKFIHPDDLSIVENAYYERMLGNETNNSYVVRLLTSKGKIFYGEITAKILDWDGAPVSMSFISNVTERVLADQKISVLNQQYKTIIEQSLEGIFIHSNRHILYVNQSFGNILLSEPESFVGKSLSDIFLNDDSEIIEYYSQAPSEVKSASKHYQVRAYDSEGKLHWLIVRSVSYLWQGAPAILNFVYDITKQKESELSLLENNELLETIMNTTPEDIICLIDSEGKIIKLNKNFVRLFNLKNVSFINKTLRELSVYAPSQKECLAGFSVTAEKAMREKSTIRKDIEIKGSSKNNHIFDSIFVPMSFKSNKEMGLVIFGRDVTEARIESRLVMKRENDYRNIVNLFRLVVDSSPDLFWAKDIEGRYLFTNKKLRKLFLGIESYKEAIGKEEDFFINRMLNRYHFNEDLFSFIQVSKSYEEKVLDTLEPVEATAGGNLHGEYYEFEFYSAPLFDNDGKVIGTFGNARDVTLENRKDRELKENEEKYRLLIENFPEAILITYDSEVLFFNQAFMQLTGYTESELENINFIQLIYQDDRNKVLNFEGRTYNFKTSDKLFEFRVLDKMNRIVYVSARSFLTKWGNQTAVISVIRDVTVEKKNMQEIFKLSEALQQSPIGMLITDLDNNIEFVNSYLCELTGYNEEELIGKNPRVFKTPNTDYSDMWYRISKGEFWSGEIKNRKKNGETYWAFCTLSTIKDKNGKIINYLCTQTDITEKKRMEDELIKAKDLAQNADKLKSEFLAQISHEIRTPINALLSFSSLIKSEIEETIDEDLRFAFASMENAGRRIIRSIDLILNLSELRIGTYDYHPIQIDLSGLLAGIFIEMKPIAEAKGVELIFKDELEGITIYKDEYSVLKIFDNIIDNAIKYTREGSVTIHAYKNKQGKVIVSVKDTGIGISKDYYEKMFAPFTQEDSGYTRKYEGNGLGLALVKEYLEINNAKLEIESEKGKGSTFSVIF